MKPRLRIAVLVFALFIIINNIVFKPHNILCWDVFGYYLYLPLKFIYHDLGLRDFSILPHIVERYHNTDTFYQVVPLPEGNYVMKYSMGMSFFYAPFFFIGHLAAKIFGYPTDGFSFPYQLSVFIGGIIYSVIGICCLAKALTRFFSSRVIIIVLALIIFGTNYLVHITMYGQNAMSHNYLFTCYALILYLTIRWHETFKLRDIILLGAVCGVGILSRPSEIVCLVIPALWNISGRNSLLEKIKLLLRYRVHVIAFLFMILLFGSFQLIYWKVQTGKFIFYSYGGNAGEGFEFFSPYFAKVLFSFRKGWLVYTPIMIFAILGFIFIYKFNRKIFLALFAYFIFNLYLVSCWSTWWYAQSFSQRALIPSYPVMAIGLGYFLTWLQPRTMLKIISYSIIAFLLFLNIFQTIQFHKGVLHPDSMTSAYYFRIFGRLDASNEDRKLLMVNRNFDGPEKFTDSTGYRSRELAHLDFENNTTHDSAVSHSGRYSFRLDSLNTFSPGYEAAFKDITKGDHAWIRISAWVYAYSNSSFSMVAHFSHKGFSQYSHPYKYMTFDSEKMNLEFNKWEKVSFDYLTPEVRNIKDPFKAYIWNRGKGTIYIDDLQIVCFDKINPSVF
jgi:hypothetical protein